MIKKIILELWDIFNYFCHLETMRFCDKYERYYPLKKEEEDFPIEVPPPDDAWDDYQTSDK